MSKKDPVCGMDVDVAPGSPRSTFQGAIFVFCSDACKRSFDADPARYTGATHGRAHH
ncbi:MAG: YHS domain-containing protein [Elusimicrobia bacterium]|nr:YHS domain-containing protein [Elusimicrobiota bacterium]